MGIFNGSRNCRGVRRVFTSLIVAYRPPEVTPSGTTRSLASSLQQVNYSVRQGIDRPVLQQAEVHQGLHLPFSYPARSYATESKQQVELMRAVEARLKGAKARHSELCHKLSSGEGMATAEMVELNKELARLEPQVSAYAELTDLQTNIKELQAIVKDDEDAEMREMAKEELATLEPELMQQQQQLAVMLLPKDEADEADCILEVRAAAGGDEASIFAMDLFKMYQKFAQTNGWRFEIISESKTEGLKGYKEAQASISGFGEGVFARLKFESGVHRVQRVPQTESQGRVHTSTASVVVLPQAEDLDVEINDSDLRIETYRASGAGGQHVNTTDSAVRITHIPTGIQVHMQDDRSQHKNKSKALSLIRARVYDEQRRLKDIENSAERKSQVGTGDRSERIRTYNYPQGRVTDHRCGLSVNDLAGMMEGTRLDDFVQEMVNQRDALLLEEMCN